MLFIAIFILSQDDTLCLVFILHVSLWSCNLEQFLSLSLSFVTFTLCNFGFYNVSSLLDSDYIHFGQEKPRNDITAFSV